MSAILAPTHAEVQARYLGMLPELERFASLRYRDLSHVEREEATQESLAWSWLWLLNAAKNGKFDEPNPRMLSLYAKRMWRCGRRFAGSTVTDVTAPQAQIAKGITVASLDQLCLNESGSPRTMGAILTDTRRPRPDEETRINLDFCTALKRPGLPRKGRVVFGKLIRDYGPGHSNRIARAMKISPARVCQLESCLATALTEIGYDPHTAG